MDNPLVPTKITNVNRARVLFAGRVLCYTKLNSDFWQQTPFPVPGLPHWRAGQYRPQYTLKS